MPRAASVSEVPSVVINQNSPVTAQVEEKAKKPRIDFWPYIASLSPTDWRDTIVYLYRDKPVVGSKNKEKYLDVLSAAFTIDDIKQRFGGEEFHAMLVKNGKILHTEHFSIEAAPKFDSAREIPGADASNAAIVDRLLDKLEQREENPASSLLTTAMTKSQDMMAQAFETALAKVAGASAGGGGADLIKTIQVLKELGLIGRQENTAVETIRMLKDLGVIGGAAQQPQNQFEMFRSMLAVVKELSGELGENSHPGNWKARLVDKAVEAAPSLIGQVGSIMDKQAAIEREKTNRANMMINARAAMPGAPAVAAPTSTDHIPVPPPAPGAPAPAPMHTVKFDRNSAPANVEAPAPQTAELTGQPSQEWVSRRVVAAIEAGQSGEAVVDFLDCINPMICQYFASLDAEGIRAKFASDAILSQAVALPRFSEWLAEVVEYLHEEGEESPGRRPN